LSPPTSGQIEIPQVRIMDTSGKVDPQTTELETQQHFLMLVNHSWARLSLLNQESLISVDRQEVPLVINDSLANQAMELARILPNGKPPLYQIQQFQADQGAAAAVNMAELTTVLAHDGSWKTHADYRIRNRSRQFLAVRLPENTQVLSAFVKGVPTAPVLLKEDAAKAAAGSAIYLLALPKTSAADLSFSVNLILSGRLPAPLPQGAFRWKSADIDLQPPQIVIPAEDPDYGIPVAQTRWSVYVPDEYSATALLDDLRTNMTPIEPVNGYSTDDISLTSMVKDVENLYSVYSSSKSDRVRSRAIDNLKQLELKLGQSETPDFGQQGQRIKQQIDEIQQREQQRQAQQQKLLNYAADPTKGGQVDFDSEETFNRLVIGNSATLFDANRDGLVQESGRIPAKPQTGAVRTLPESKSQLKGFYFRKEQDKKGVIEGKAVLPQEVDGRALRRKQSLMNANEQIQSQLGIQQQAEMPNAPALDFSDRIQSEPTAGMGGIGGGVQFGNRSSGKDSHRWAAPKNPAKIPFGGPAGLQSHTIRNLESKALPTPVDSYIVEVEDAGQGQQAAWTQAGGISLDFEIPLHGHKLVFTKINGQPKLALSVRPENTYEFGAALLWTICWTLILIGLIWCVSRNLQSAVAQKGLWLLLTLIGLTGWLLLSGIIAGLAIVCFIAGAIGLAYRYVKQAA
ncbi:MAG: hypothetical protein KDA77_03915, partial [Planctomycetaceae bacterium]|nr:hypothetical protein [Planctomycetaceae bacterium]